MDGLPDFSEGRALLMADPSVLKYVHLLYGGLISGVKKKKFLAMIFLNLGMGKLWFEREASKHIFQQSKEVSLSPINLKQLGKRLQEEVG